MKRLLLWLLASLLLFVVVGCGDVKIDVVSFDNNSFSLQSQNGFVQIPTRDVSANYLGSDLKVVFQENVVASGDFVDTLLVSKIKIAKDSTFESFVSVNKEKLTNAYQDISIDEEGFGFVCKEVDIFGVLLLTDLKNVIWSDDVYLAEYLFVKQSTVFVISFASESKSARSLFIKSLDSLHCK